jgi:hypothetical protein
MHDVRWIESAQLRIQEQKEILCPHPQPKPKAQGQAHEVDPVEAVVSAMPLVLPIAGAVLMFLLAFIAVSMA